MLIHLARLTPFPRITSFCRQTGPSRLYTHPKLWYLAYFSLHPPVLLARADMARSASLRATCPITRARRWGGPNTLLPLAAARRRASAATTTSSVPRPPRLPSRATPIRRVCGRPSWRPPMEGECPAPFPPPTGRRRRLCGRLSWRLMATTTSSARRPPRLPPRAAPIRQVCDRQLWRQPLEGGALSTPYPQPSAAGACLRPPQLVAFNVGGLS